MVLWIIWKEFKKNLFFFFLMVCIFLHFSVISFLLHHQIFVRRSFWVKNGFLCTLFPLWFSSWTFLYRVQIAIEEYFKKQNKSKKINSNYFFFVFFLKTEPKNENILVRNGATSKHAHRHNQKQGRDRRFKKKHRNQKKMTRGFVSDLKNIQQGNMYCT